jgi:MFS family permease
MASLVNNLRTIAPCLLAIIVDAMGFGLVYPILTMMFAGSHRTLLGPAMSAAEADFLFSLGYLLYPAGMFFGASVLGDLSDRFGRKPVLLICIGGLSVATAMMAAGIELRSVTVLLLGRFLSGLMAGSQPIAQAAVSDLSTESQRALNMSLLTLALSIGIVLGPVMGGVLSEHTLESWFDFSTPLWTAAAIGCISFVWILLGFRDTSQPSGEPLDWLRSLKVFAQAFTTRAVRSLSVVHLLFQLGFSVYYAMISVLLVRNWNDPPAQIGLFNGVVGLGFVIALIVVMPLATSRLGDKSLALLGLLINGAGVALSGLAVGQGALWALALVVGIGDMVAYTAMLTLFSKSVPSSQCGWAMGIATSVMAVAWVLTGLAPNLLGIVSLELMLIGAGVLVLAAAAVLMAASATDAAKEPMHRRAIERGTN